MCLKVCCSKCQCLISYPHISCNTADLCLIVPWRWVEVHIKSRSGERNPNSMCVTISRRYRLRSHAKYTYRVCPGGHNFYKNNSHGVFFCFWCQIDALQHTTYVIKSGSLVLLIYSLRASYFYVEKIILFLVKGVNTSSNMLCVASEFKGLCNSPSNILHHSMT